LPGSFGLIGAARGVELPVPDSSSVAASIVRKASLR
jgi:hypothetical protein